MRRLTDNDKRWGPLTWGKTDWNPWRLVFSTGGSDDDGAARNNLTWYVFGYVFRLWLPTLMQPYRIKHIAESWDAATVARLGRNWYYETHPREYGFSLNDGFLQVFLGPQTHDSSTTKSWSKFLPWTQWRHVRFTLYDLDGQHFWTQYEKDRRAGGRHFDDQMEAERLVPKATFQVLDYDGETNTATTHIKEREWRFGEGRFKWLSLFRRPRIRRSLSIRFTKELGPEKGSWKGGLCGTGITMLAHEDAEAAFKRYCEQDHRSKYRTYRITYAGRVE